MFFQRVEPERLNNWKVDDTIDVACLPATFLLPTFPREICHER